MKEYYETERRGLYRSRNDLICGVCAGLAEYFDLSVFWTRVVAVGLLICTGFWPIGALYILAALVMRRDPYVNVDYY